MPVTVDWVDAFGERYTPGEAQDTGNGDHGEPLEHGAGTVFILEDGRGEAEVGTTGGAAGPSEEDGRRRDDGRAGPGQILTSWLRDWGEGDVHQKVTRLHTKLKAAVRGRTAWRRLWALATRTSAAPVLNEAEMAEGASPLTTPEVDRPQPVQVLEVFFGRERHHGEEWRLQNRDSELQSRAAIKTGERGPSWGVHNPEERRVSRINRSRRMVAEVAKETTDGEVHILVQVRRERRRRGRRTRQRVQLGYENGHDERCGRAGEVEPLDDVMVSKQLTDRLLVHLTQKKSSHSMM